MNPVRPNMLPPGAQPGQPQRPADAARAAAQRAFFEAAMGKTAAPAASAPAPPAQVAAPVQRTADPAAGKPEKILRPGSLLDIRV